MASVGGFISDILLNSTPFVCKPKNNSKPRRHYTQSQSNKLVFQQTTIAMNPMHTPYPSQINFESSTVAQAIKTGRCGSDPSLVTRFIQEQAIISERGAREEQWRVQDSLVKFLFEVTADSLLAKCWRSWCLQCCCMPLHRLNRLSTTKSECEKYQKLEQELLAMKSYYLS